MNGAKKDKRVILGRTSELMNFKHANKIIDFLVVLLLKLYNKQTMLNGSLICSFTDDVSLWYTLQETVFK